MPSPSERQLKEVAEILSQAQSVGVLTGAGISAESGVPTFRDPDGLWAKFKPEELANFEAFMANTELVWQWYEHRREIIRSVKPNPGHTALVELEKKTGDFLLVTQNVDNLHQNAGNEKIVELHGNIMRSYCIDCRKDEPEVKIEKGKPLPHCKHCNGKIRPGVVWFGEMLPEGAFAKAEEFARICQVFLSVGTSAAVYPAAALPLMAKESGATVIEINPNPTEISRYLDHCLFGPSGEILPQLVELAFSRP